VSGLPSFVPAPQDPSMGGSGAPVLAHDALFFGTDSELVDALVPFVRDGLARNESVVAVLTRANLRVLRDALDDDADAVTFADRDDWYQRPAITIANWQQALSEATDRGHRDVRLIGEVAFGRPDRHATWSRYESALNRVFADAPAWIVCPYDTRVLPPALLAQARHTHPTVLAPTRMPSDGYVAVEDFLLSVPEPIPVVSGPPTAVFVLEDTVAPARRAVRHHMAGLGWGGSDRLDDLLLVLSEVASNSICHGRCRRELRVWADEHRVVCQVGDDGPGPSDPLASYQPPSQSVTGGRGLWIAQQLSDVFAVEHRADRTAVWFAISVAGE
jgi:anti-sigma regulatory factor (Ser/Thr protein kinase)